MSFCCTRSVHYLDLCVRLYIECVIYGFEDNKYINQFYDIYDWNIFLQISFLFRPFLVGVQSSDYISIIISKKCGY